MVPNNNPNLFVLSMNDDKFILIPIVGFIYGKEELTVVDLSGKTRNDGWVLDSSTMHIHILNHDLNNRFSLDSFCSGITDSQQKELLEQLPQQY